MRAKLYSQGIVAVAMLIAVGCGEQEMNPSPEAELPSLPSYMEGTIAEQARLVHGGPTTVQGYGVVIGLGEDGSSEIPSHLANYLSQYLRMRDLGRWSRGTEELTPQRFLRDPDTAIVLIGGSIPPGAPKGARFDLQVTALPQTQTTSLEGGILMPAELRLAIGGMAPPGGPSRVVADGAGSVLVNPFVDDEDRRSQIAALRQGRIVGGGRTNWSRGLRLQLLEPNHARADLIGRRINARFSTRDHTPANARDSSIVELEVPRQYRNDYEHFLDLVMHLPLEWGGQAEESRAWEIARKIESPDADHEQLALIWEAMGRQILPIIKEQYTSSTPAAAFYAARTGLRLGDESAADVVLRFAEESDSELQTAAIRELGRHRSVLEGRRVLERLLSDRDEYVRFVAYQALLRRGDSSAIQRISVGGDFEIHTVRSDRQYLIYASQTNRPRIILFGRDMPIRKPVFYNSEDDLVTISARRDEDKLLVYRRIPWTDSYSDPFQVNMFVRDLARTLGERPERGRSGEIKGLGLTYGQIVSILYKMCENDDIPARFVLQPLPDLQRMYHEAPTAGRPDAPTGS